MKKFILLGTIIAVIGGVASFAHADAISDAQANSGLFQCPPLASWCKPHPTPLPWIIYFDNSGVTHQMLSWQEWDESVAHIQGIDYRDDNGNVILYNPYPFK